jgi:hypothetical protein
MSMNLLDWSMIFTTLLTFFLMPWYLQCFIVFPTLSKYTKCEHNLILHQKVKQNVQKKHHVTK